jgi:DNA segregation ATPase FtsK/SpoIIIE-like protein
MALGKDISGSPLVMDLARMPHLLIGGSTGSGKSVAVNAMICSILLRATSDQVKLILIDPKMVEMGIYEDIPHLWSPVVTDMKEAGRVLRWVVAQMEERYKRLALLSVRNLEQYNEKIENRIKNLTSFYISLPYYSNGNVIILSHNGVIKEQLFDINSLSGDLSLEEGGFYVISNKNKKLTLEYKFTNFNSFSKVFYNR